MEITIEQVNARVPITILRVVGNLDGTSYEKFIEVAKAQYADGARNFLIDLSETPYLSSAGLVAMHTLVKLARGEAPSDPASGWSALHAIEREESQGTGLHVKLLNPQPKVQKVIELAGMQAFLPIFTDRDKALASF